MSDLTPGTDKSIDVPVALADTAATSDLVAAASTGPIEGGLADYGRTYWKRVQGGDMGSLPAVCGLIVLVIFFSIIHPEFRGLVNFANLITQAAPTVMLAIGLVFVLLLGEIDLSAGTAGGVCASVMAALIFNHGWPWWAGVLAAIVTGIVIGYVIGWLVAKLRVPSFVVTLAFFLAFQGVQLWVIGKGGAIALNSNVIDDIENTNMPAWAGWLTLVLFAGIYAVYKIATQVSRRRNRLVSEPFSLVAIKVFAIVVIGAIAVALLNQNRALQKSSLQSVDGKLVLVKQTLSGVPWVVPFLLAIYLILTFLLGRTRYGRHVYAVGGNREAARRAGIPVDRIRISVFVFCSFMASLSGILYGSTLRSVNDNLGGGNTLLLAVGAAAIGGTSLFGGKGRIVDAVVGGLVLTVITNGMADLITGNNQSAIQWIVTGAVLLIAAAVDALARRRSAGAGLG
jgi:D-xylose transport system permease protein